MQIEMEDGHWATASAFCFHYLLFVCVMLVFVSPIAQRTPFMASELSGLR